MSPPKKRRPRRASNARGGTAALQAAGGYALAPDHSPSTSE
jgi:hypothetical protein